jgi:hypothetical protein
VAAAESALGAADPSKPRARRMGISEALRVPGSLFLCSMRYRFDYTLHAGNSNGSRNVLTVGADDRDPGPPPWSFALRAAEGVRKAPEHQYASQTIRVTGAVSDYRGVRHTGVASPDAIEVGQ